VSVASLTAAAANARDTSTRHLKKSFALLKLRQQVGQNHGWKKWCVVMDKDPKRIGIWPRG
jgi:hypothetical protein